MRINSIGIRIGIACFVFIGCIVMKTLTNDSKAANLDQIHTHAPDYPKNENGQTYGSGLDTTKTTMNQSPTKIPNYPKNENGQTYGSGLDDATSIETLPDLILAGSVDGTAGYLLKKDFLGEQSKTPDEAITIQKSRPPDGRNVPLYDVDGKTIIGSFRVGAMNQNPTKAPNYPKNENGQTYGSASDATSPDTEPDLIQAIGVDGNNGYVKTKDLRGEMPKNPEEALAQQKSRPAGGRDIPLYDVDGKTVIGVYNIG